MPKPSLVALATGMRSVATQVHCIRGASKGLLGWGPSFVIVRRVCRVRHDLIAHYHSNARRSGGWRDRGHVGRRRAGFAPMATAITDKLRPPQLAASSFPTERTMWLVRNQSFSLRIDLLIDIVAQMSLITSLPKASAA